MVCLYILCIQIHVWIHNVYKYVHIYRHSKGIGIWASALNLYNQVLVLLLTECNPFIFQGQLSLAHYSNNTTWQKDGSDRKPPLHIPYTSPPSPAALRTPFLGSVKFNSFQPLGHFETTPCRWVWGSGGTERSQRGRQVCSNLGN